MSSSNVNHLSQPCIYGAGHVVSSYADRKSRFMKWLSLRNYIQIPWFALRLSNRRVPAGEQQPQSFGDENTANKENEELDRAIILSLAEELKKPKENDEELSRTPNDVFISVPIPSNAPSDNFHRGHRLCSGCKGEADSSCVEMQGGMGMFYHSECYRCHACRYPISDNKVVESGRDIYHISCYIELDLHRCEVCHQFIPTIGDGSINYKMYWFWPQIYCPSHEQDNTARCNSCERFESWNTRHMLLGDGRSICLECMESAIMDTDDCQLLYHSIRDFFEGINMRIDQQIPVALVERQALNEVIEGEKYGYHRSEMEGLFLAQHRAVNIIPHKKRIRWCEISAILVLYGLPRLLTGAHLAHELMHAWLNLNGYRNLASEVEEGICQVLSLMWLESELLPEIRNMTSSSTTSSSSMKWSYGLTSMSSTSSSSSPWTSSKKGISSSVENKLGKYFIQEIRNHTSPIYGGGFRAAISAVNKHGLLSTLDHIRYTGKFPR